MKKNASGIDMLSISWQAIIEVEPYNPDCDELIFVREKRSDELLHEFINNNEQCMISPKYFINGVDLALWLNLNVYLRHVIGPGGDILNTLSNAYYSGYHPWMRLSLLELFGEKIDKSVLESIGYTITDDSSEWLEEFSLGMPLLYGCPCSNRKCGGQPVKIVRADRFITWEMTIVRSFKFDFQAYKEAFQDFSNLIEILSKEKKMDEQTLTINTIRKGSLVKVKSGVNCPDFDYQSMDSWQGKVIEIDAETELIEVAWDAKTLLDMPDKYIVDLIKNGYDYEESSLELAELERAEKRDSLIFSEEIEGKLKAKLYWLELFEDAADAKRYYEFFKGVDSTDYNSLFQRWEEFFMANLIFPFDAKIVEGGRGNLKNGDTIKLLDVDGYEDMYGVFGHGKSGRHAVTLPMCNLEALDKETKNYKFLRDYVIWFANM